MRMRIYSLSMSNLAFIRTELFKVTQAVFGEIAGAAQGTVSRWELPENHPDRLEPSREQLGSIRESAKQRGIQWRDEWFFDLPDGASSASSIKEPAEASL